MVRQLLLRVACLACQNMTAFAGVEIPDHIEKLTVRAHDSVHEYGGRGVSVDLRGRH